MVQNSKEDTLLYGSDPELKGGSMSQISMFKPGQLVYIEKSDLLLVYLLSLKGKVPTRGLTLAGGYDLYIAKDAVIPPHT